MSPLCAIDGCAVEAHARGWCKRHYHRWYRYGDPEAPGRKAAEHGRSMYTNHGCRCDVCRADWAAYTQSRKKQREQFVAVNGLPEGVSHGESAYGNWGCRCDVCTTAHSTATVERRKRKQAKK